MRVARRFAWLSLGAALAACTQDVTAPGRCPEFCPSGSLTIIDTVLATSISKDSAFRGFVRPQEAGAMAVADLPGVVDSRAIFRTVGFPTRMAIATNDTTTGAVLSADSAKLTVTIAHRDTAAHNLTLWFYRLPLTIDSTTTFEDLKVFFAESLRTVNVDSLLARPGRKDTLTGDSVVVDSVQHVLTLTVKLHTSQARYAPADTGQLGFGVRVSADVFASIALGSSEAGVGPYIRWFVTVDSLGTPVHRTEPLRLTSFDSFVFDPPPAPLNSALAVGGVPSARSILRVALPRVIRDSSQIVRATLILVPSLAPRGVPADSFILAAHAVQADFGAKSPLALDSARTVAMWIRIGTADTVRVEVTRLLRFWAADTLAPTTMVLRQAPEGVELAEIRFHSSADAAFRPALRVTYVPRFPFGVP